MVEKLISSILGASNRFLRSTDLVRDFEDPNGLDGYWLTDFGRDCLAQIACGFSIESGRRAWRLTGDFGSGKSSFALLLANALRDPNRLPHGLRAQVLKSLPMVRRSSFIPVLVAGSREPISNAVVRALNNTMVALYTRGAKSALAEEIEEALKHKTIPDHIAIELLTKANAKFIQGGKGDGILLIMDEVGKFLEFAALHPDRQDVIFLQQLAETACRSGKSPLVVICLFHQGFNAYAEQLAKSTQKEWDKIAGRFDEITFHQPLDQVAQLASTALRTDVKRLFPSLLRSASASMEEAIRLGWYGTTSSRDSLRCLPGRLFPLDPMVLPVLVRVFRRFGQNERSLFGFLCSHEPFGLRAFSQQPLDEKSRPYQLGDLYDYVRANFGHRLGAASYRAHWNVIESTIEAYQPDNPMALRILKTVGLLNLLNADDLMPTEEAVAWAVAGDCSRERREVAQLLEKITATRILHFRGKGRGYSIWSHTSVDLDERLEKAKQAIPAVGSISEAIASQLPCQPIVARAHYIKTGNLRYFDVVYCQPDELAAKAAEYVTRADGFILAPLCEEARDTKVCESIAAGLSLRKDTIRLVAVPRPLCHLHQAVLDAMHWEWVQSHTPELNNDRIARDEVQIYLQEARYRLQGQVQAYLGMNRYAGETSLKWHYFDHEGKASVGQFTSRGVLELLSSLCDEAFSRAPQIKNELVNRHNLSSAAAAARMRLIELLFAASGKVDLGMPIDKRPPEKSMYYSVLKNTNLHCMRDGAWRVCIPTKREDVGNVRPALIQIKSMLEENPDSRIPVSEIMDKLRRPPYGLRDGLFPILLAVMAIEYEHEIAFYENGTFIREVGKDVFLRMTKAPDKFEIQFCKIEGVRSSLFQHLVQVLGVAKGTQDIELLDVVRNLCQFVARLPEYAQGTRRLAPVTLAVREVILQAREPVKMVFHDLPSACGFEKFAIGKSTSAAEARHFVGVLKDALDDLRSAFPALQQRIALGIAKEFGYDSQSARQFRGHLASRAEKFLVRGSENKLKAFAFRLIDEVLSESDWLGSVGSVLALRPPDKWKDEDEDTFQRELENLAGRFKRAESVDYAQGGDGQGIRIAITKADGTERQEVIYIDPAEEQSLLRLQMEIATMIKKHQHLGLAAASRAIWAQLKTQDDAP